MALIRPAELLEGYQFLAGGELAPEPGIFIPLASLDLSAADAENDGDGRKVVFAIVKEVFNRLALLGVKPAGLTITKSIPVGVNPWTVRQTYRFSFDFFLDFSDYSFDLIAE